jgi:hypothetical protein
MRFLIRSLAAAVFLAACTAIQTVQPADLSPPHPPTRVWLTRADQSVAVFDSARVEGDSLVGFVNGRTERVPLAGATIQTRQLSPGRTAALAGVVAGVGAALVEVANGNGPHCVNGVLYPTNPGCSCCNRPPGGMCVC